MIRSAVVGTGYLGKFHAEKYHKIKDTQLLAVVDSDEATARKIAKSVKAQPLTSYKELPALGVECASVVTPTSTHFEVASWLLENGIDVLLEKPMTTTVEDARRLIEIASSNGRVLQVGHLERFNPAFRAMKEVLNRPWFFEVRRIAQFTGRGADVDVVMDLMIHDIDIIAHLVNQPVLKVEAVGIPVLTGSVDIANARLTFEGGTIANVTASRAAFKSERSIRIFQPDLYISLDYGKKKLKIYQKTEGFDSLLGIPKIDIKELKVEERDALEHEIDSFLRCVRERGTPEVTGQDGLRALELADRIRMAFAEHLQSLGFDSSSFGEAAAARAAG
ncbi:MAG: Gfo/Idh/MocA family oxidoreductase [Bdellovibrionales bacterium]|nr:Gfo/Idh/MocA family oxidoreductase [Bdellovibrionales bacterium]